MGTTETSWLKCTDLRLLLRAVSDSSSNLAMRLVGGSGSWLDLERDPSASLSTSTHEDDEEDVQHDVVAVVTDPSLCSKSCCAIVVPSENLSGSMNLTDVISSFNDS